MTKRSLAAILAVGMMSSTLPVFAAPGSATGQGTATANAWVDPPRASAPAKPSVSAAAQPAVGSPSSKSTDTASPETTSSVSKAADPTNPAPKVIDAKKAIFGVAGRAEESAQTKVAASEKPVPRAASASPASASKKPASARTARYASNEGGAWKVGRNAYAFSGSFGGCRISGRAGPGGFTIDRSC